MTKSLTLKVQERNDQSSNRNRSSVLAGLFAVPIKSTTCTRFNEQIKTLDRLKWKDKTIRVFEFGDYDAICKILGISGAASTYPCYACLIDRDDMQKPRRNRKECKARTILNVSQDHASFIQSGANVKKQADHHNAVHSPILSIPVSAICPPYLHILLGVIKKHHDLLEQECHKIDLDIAIDKAKQPGTLSRELFERYVAHMKEKAKLETKLARLESNIEDLEENCSLATLMKERVL